MTSERSFWEICKRDLTCDITSSKRKRHSLETLASVRALIVTPSTSSDTVSSVLETLTQCLQEDQEPLHHHILKLLSELARDHRWSHSIFEPVLAYAASHKDSSCLAAEALAVLFTIAEHNQSSSDVSISELNEDLFLSLCLSPSASVRSWLLLNADKFHVQPFLLANVMLEFTKDPYPYVRRAALSGLVHLSKLVDTKETKLIQECYDCAVELFLEEDECVRSAAVQTVSQWGHMLTSDNEVDERDWSDAVFVQLCSMARDMSVGVRTEAFVALGKVKSVSEDILLQTLSKKPLGVIKERKVIGQCTAKQFDTPASNVAGVFVHGIEDEFYVVRRSVCNSLGMLAVFSVCFANDAIHLLTDLLNDDTMVVRLQSLETMYDMATFDRLKMKEMDMHMFLGTLMHDSSLTRHAARKVLRLMKLSGLEMFKSSVNGLLTNLESYPEDEADIFFALFSIGRGHGKFAVNFVREVSKEIEPSCEGELPLDKARVAAILVLAIAATLAIEQGVCNIPRRMFRYAIPFLGRISQALRTVITQDALLGYLSHSSRFMHSTVESFEDGHCISGVGGGDILNPDMKESMSCITPLQQICYGTSEIQSQNNLWDPENLLSFEECQKKSTSMQEEAKNEIVLVLRIVAETWTAVKSGSIDEVQKTLRSFVEELSTIAVDSHGSVSLVAFASQYIKVIQLLAEAWEHLLPSRKFPGNGASFEILLEKLDMNLRRMRYGFSGLSDEEDLHILEIVLLIYFLKLSKIKVCSHLTILKRLRAVISRIELLCEKGFAKLSDFASEVRKLFSQEGVLDDQASYHSFPFKRILEAFSLKPIVFSGIFLYISADLDVPGNNSENPLPFISGFPVGITFNITLRNVSGEDRFWLKMTMEEIAEYVFLDLYQFEDCDAIRKVKICVPFYRTPKAASFSVRACIGKECIFEDVYVAKGEGGPKHELAFLCNEKIVYFAVRS